jgi:hypothetical protein
MNISLLANCLEMLLGYTVDTITKTMGFVVKSSTAASSPCRAHVNSPSMYMVSYTKTT